MLFSLTHTSLRHLPPAYVVLWVYIILLELGGLIGFLKANSKVSLITSSIFAGALVLCAVEILPWRWVYILQALLLVVFSILLSRSKKFMPSGLMLILTIAAILLEYHPIF